MVASQNGVGEVVITILAAFGGLALAKVLGIVMAILRHSGTTAFKAGNARPPRGLAHKLNAFGVSIRADKLTRPLLVPILPDSVRNQRVIKIHPAKPIQTESFRRSCPTEPNQPTPSTRKPGYASDILTFWKPVGGYAISRFVGAWINGVCPG